MSLLVSETIAAATIITDRIAVIDAVRSHAPASSSRPLYRRPAAMAATRPSKGPG
jgi:hypothetical protein